MAVGACAHLNPTRDPLSPASQSFHPPLPGPQAKGNRPCASVLVTVWLTFTSSSVLDVTLNVFFCWEKR